MTESHYEHPASARPRALEGLRVLDVTQFMAGPYCSTILADLGADVIKIEPPSGDSTRQMVGASGSESPSFNAVNRGKRSLVVNLKTLDGQELFKRLVRSSDILVENYRPGVMQAFGLGYDALAAINPALIEARFAARFVVKELTRVVRTRGTMWAIFSLLRKVVLNENSTQVVF
jgi:crotonobetainyl-CoA:carnitine CoA-transferase CaiB-like acyl-CoA transferase